MQALKTAFLVGASMLAVSAGAGAQMRSARIPAAYIPPAGQCRLWVNGLVAARQSAPTDCATARANLRPNTRLVYGAALRPNGTRGEYDPRRDPRSPQYDPRIDDRGQGVWTGREDDRRSDKDRRKHDREMRKREKERDKEWKKSRRHGDDDEDDDEDDDDHDGDHHDRDHRGNRDRGVYDGRVGRDRRNDQDPWWGRGQGTGRTECVDRNHDGVCDSQQGVGARVRIP